MLRPAPFRVARVGPPAARVVAVLLVGCAVAAAPLVHVDRATPTDTFIGACRAGHATACIVAGLRYLRDSKLDPPMRIGAGKLFERACVLGRADGCHAAGLVAPVLDAVALHDRACELGFRAGCERAEDLRGRTPRSCAHALVDSAGRRVAVPDGTPRLEPLERVAPSYPPEALAAPFEGAPLICLRISREGFVRAAEIVEDAPLLGEAARATVLLWRFPRVGAASVAGVVVPWRFHFRVP